MAAKDKYHDCVKNALVKDGWVITHDPLRLSWGGKDLYVDLGAEQFLAAEKGERQIAVEIKSFLGDSEIDDLEKALGQFVLYRAVLAARHPGWELFLAVPEDAARDVFDAPLGRLMVADQSVRIFGFDTQSEVITRWIHGTD
jgi:XisH protein